MRGGNGPARWKRPVRPAGRTLAKHDGEREHRRDGAGRSGSGGNGGRSVSGESAVGSPW